MSRTPYLHADGRIIRVLPDRAQRGQACGREPAQGDVRGARGETGAEEEAGASEEAGARE